MLLYQAFAVEEASSGEFVPLTSNELRKALLSRAFQQLLHAVSVNFRALGLGFRPECGCRGRLKISRDRDSIFIHTSKLQA